MKKEQVLAKLRSCGLVAVVRAKDADDAMRIAEACIEGGCAGIELTYTTPASTPSSRRWPESMTAPTLSSARAPSWTPRPPRMAILSPAPSMWSAPTNGDTVRLCNRYRVASACPAP